MNGPTPKAATLLTLGVLLLVLFSATRGLHRGLPCHYSYHQDEIAPVRALGYLERYTDPIAENVDKYTPLAYLWYGIPARIALAMRGDEHSAALLALARERGPQAWPNQFDPSVWSDMEVHRDAISDCIVAGRLAAALANVLASLGAALLVGRVFGATLAPVAALLTGLSPYLVYYGHTMNNDEPAFAFLLLGLAAFAFAQGARTLLPAILAGAALAIAGAIKDQFLAFVVCVPLAQLALDLFAVRSGSPARLEWRARFAMGAAFVLVYALAADLVFDLPGYVRHLRFGTSSTVVEQYQMADPKTLKGAFLLVLYTLTYFYRSCGVGGALLMLAGGIYGWRKRKDLLVAWLAPAAAYHFVFLFLRGFVYPRFLVPCFLPLLFLGLGAAHELWRSGARARLLAIAILGCVLAVAWRGYTVNTLWERDPRIAAATWIAERVPNGTRLLAVGNHAVPPPRMPVGVPHRWAHAADFALAMKEFQPQVLVRMMSTNIAPVMRPIFPWPIPDASRATMAIVAEFGRELYEPEPAHPILYDIDAFPGVLVVKG